METWYREMLTDDRTASTAFRSDLETFAGKLRELSGRVLSNAVAPGFFASEMSEVLGQTQLDAILRRTPSGRLTTPEEVVPVVRMLLLEDTNINGQSIVIDGAGSI